MSSEMKARVAEAIDSELGRQGIAIGIVLAAHGGPTPDIDMDALGRAAIAATREWLGERAAERGQTTAQHLDYTCALIDAALKE